MGKQLIALFAAVLALALMGAGCGGSSTPSPSKAEFVKKAEVICKDNSAKIQKSFRSYINEHEDLKNPTKADYLDLVSTVLVPHIEEEIDELKALGAPKGDEDQVDAIIEAREAGVGAIETYPEEAVENNSAFKESSELARKYGLRYCGLR